MFSGANINPDFRSKTAGTTISYAMSKGVDISADYKHYNRESGSANRYGGDLKLMFLNNSLRVGAGYHYLNAGESFAVDSNPSGSYQEFRVYALHDTKSYFSAINLLGYFFKDTIYKESSALEGTFSLGYHITPSLAISGDISQGRNPDFLNETKGLVRLTYNPFFSAKGDKK
jgi:hypothetical protein